MSGKVKAILYVLLAACFGLIAIIIPVWSNNSIKYYDAPLFPLFKTGIEGYSFHSIISFFLFGIIVGLIKHNKSYIYALAMILFFPLIAFTEMVIDPSSHNLWPIEFVIYILMVLPGILGAVISNQLYCFVMKRIKKE